MRSVRCAHVAWLVVVLGHLAILAASAFSPTQASDSVFPEAVLGGPLTSSPIAHWAFEEGEGTTAIDSSINANHGTVIAAAWTEGRIGGALQFNGTPSRVVVPDSPSLRSFTNEFSFSAWINGSNLTMSWTTLLHRNRPDGRWYDWIVFARADDAQPRNAPVLRFDWDGDNLVDPDEEVAGDAPLEEDTWYHLAGTYDGAALKFYVDGRLTDTTLKAGASIPNSALPVWIGASSTWGEHFVGVIDEVRLYNEALTPEEVWALAHPGAAPEMTCEDFEVGYTLGQELRVHPDWFYEDIHAGPQPLAGTGVAGSIGLSNGNTGFAWVAHEFDWNSPALVSYSVQMDYQTSASGVFDDDRLGWTISNTDDSSDWHFGVQMDPGGTGAGGNIECYWDGDTFGDDGGRASIVDLPALAGDTWYRLRAVFTKLTTTSCRIDVTLTELNAAGGEIGIVASGTLPDTDLLPGTAGEEIPNPGYFTAASMWPMFKNHDGTPGACDNACLEIITGTPGQHTLTVNVVGNGSVTLDPPGGIYDAGTEVELTADADPDWIFAGWSGDLTGYANPETVIMNDDLTVTATFVEEGTPSCEDFETGYTLGAELRTHPDWFYEDANSGPVPEAGTGVAGSIGLSNGNTGFAWVAHELHWNSPALLSYSVQMDYQTSASGVFDDDRLGWTISNTDDSSDWHFGVQMDPGGGGAGGNIECYWDGDTFGDDGGRASIVDLPALAGNTWYRLRAVFTKLTTTSCRIDVTLIELDAAGAEVGIVVSGTLADTDLLPGTAGEESPNPGYFTAVAMWPMFKNFDNTAGACDNTCFQVVTGIPGQHTLTVNTVGNGSVTLDPPGGVYDAGTEVELTADPDPGWMFAGWSGDLTGYANPETVIMNDDLTVTATFVEEGLPSCEDFEAGYTLGAELRTHSDWFYEDIHSGPIPEASTGVAGSIGLSDGNTSFAWVAHEFYWNQPNFMAYRVRMDYQTSASGVFDDDRLGWTISNTDDSSDWHFGVQMDPGGGGAGGNIECYWDGDTFGDDGGRASIVDLPALSGSTWYRLEAVFTKLTTTSCRIDVTLTELDAAGSEVAVVVTGALPDTDLLPGTAGQEIPNPGYFTAAAMWPMFKNYDATAGACDNACFQVVTGITEQHTLTVNIVGNGSVTLDPPGGVYDAGTPVELLAEADPSWVFDGWSGDLTGFSNPETVTMNGDMTVTATFVPGAPLATGDVIIAAMQGTNNPAGQDPGELIELFNTTGVPISLEGMQIITRLDNNADGLVEVEWQLAADLTGKIIAPYSFFLIAESGVAAPGGIHDVETDMDLATGEGGAAERAISVELVIDGLHMDYLVYGRYDGSTPAGELPPGDLPFDGASWPRTEVIRNTQGTDNFAEGLLRRETADDLYAGFDVEGFYTDEDALGDGYPPGVWYSPHQYQFGAYEARNSTSPAVLPGGSYPPDQPTQLTPPDDGTGVALNCELRASVTDPDLDALEVTFYGRQVPDPAEEYFTLIPLPDTQKYSDSYPGIYMAQTQWIVDNREARDIVFVAHEGDIVDHADAEDEWINADAAMSLLENPVTTGLPDGIPYSMLPGNHDQPTTLYNTYFGEARFLGRDYYGGHYNTDNDDSYCLFEAAGMDFIVISFEYEPGSAAIAWADGLLQTFSDRRGIVVTHCMLETDGTWLGPGQAIYDGLKDNPNLFLMLCGHRHGEALRTDEYLGHQVHSVLADYQDMPNGGNGWLRIMEFQPAHDRIRVLTYSPTLDEYGTDTGMGYGTTSQEFFLPYDMDSRDNFTMLGTVDVSGRADAVLNWPGLSANTEYEWYVSISDGYHTTVGPVCSFTTTTGGTDVTDGQGPVKLARQRTFPSPFFSQTSVQFTLPAAGHTEIVVLDLLGRRVAILGDREFPAGRNTVTWDGRDRMGRPVGAGTYVVLIRNGDSVLTNKVTLIR